jgi:hypothetical protein
VKPVQLGTPNHRHIENGFCPNEYAEARGLNGEGRELPGNLLERWRKRAEIVALGDVIGKMRERRDTHTLQPKVSLELIPERPYLQTMAIIK